MKTGLAELIHPLSTEDFTARYEANEPVVIHHAPETLKELMGLPFLASLEDMLKSWPAPIQAHLPDLRDESSSIDTTPADAAKLFKNGMGLLFNEVQKISPLLKQRLEVLRKDLGLSALTYARCLVYATPDGKGTAPHFDQNINFVLQIHGTKTWRLAPNTHVANPMTRHTMGSEPDSELDGYLEDELPTEMPTDSQTVVLKPGSVLFVPRGYWHSTEAQSEALALNFTFTAPTWIDLFTTALRSRLSLSPEWRATADGVADPENRDAAEAYLETLLTMVVEDLPHWQADDILAATEPVIEVE
ncbi:MAG: cupin domain-containing protein [Bdellovibrionaceae bacterium]|nr:cupin domain-containing protein [Pseudobdellovibrionaceae bacterium]